MALCATWTQVGGLITPGWVAWVRVSDQDPKHPMSLGESLTMCPGCTVRCIKELIQYGKAIDLQEKSG